MSGGLPITLEEHVRLLFRALLVIGERESVNLSELAEALGKNRPQVYTLVNTLESLGLVTKERIKALPPRTIIKPTNKGKKLIQCLLEIELI